MKPSGEYIIKNVKCSDNGSTKLQITFDWPVGVQDVYIFASHLASDNFDIHQAAGKIFTLQEYKKLGGFETSKMPGRTFYYIYPFVRCAEEGDILHNQDGTNFTEFCEITKIKCLMREKNGIGASKNFEITLSANYPVGSDIICYVKKKNEIPTNINDGTLYQFGAPLEPGQDVTRVVRTARNEYIRLFAKGEFYGIV